MVGQELMVMQQRLVVGQDINGRVAEANGRPAGVSGMGAG